MVHLRYTSSSNTCSSQCTHLRNLNFAKLTQKQRMRLSTIDNLAPLETSFLIVLIPRMARSVSAECGALWGRFLNEIRNPGPTKPRHQKKRSKARVRLEESWPPGYARKTRRVYSFREAQFQFQAPGVSLRNEYNYTV